MRLANQYIDVGPDLGFGVQTEAPAPVGPCEAEPTDIRFQTDGVGDIAGIVNAMNEVSDAAFRSMVEFGSSSSFVQNGSKTRFFQTVPCPGDGLIAIDFHIASEVSGGFLKGDNRAVDPDPLRLGKKPDSSRMVVVIDRESGRGLSLIHI